MSAFANPVPAKRATDVLPLTTLGNVGAAQTVSGATTLVWQEEDGGIYSKVVTGPFTTGSTDGHATIALVPAAEALLGTPIVSVGNSSAPGSIFTDVSISSPLQNFPYLGRF